MLFRSPASVPEPLVAQLDLEWEREGERLITALDAVLLRPQDL